MDSFRISTKHINRAKAKLQEMPSNQKDLHEGSILEKLLSIDEQTAYVMALDMLTAGVDTVSARFRCPPMIKMIFMFNRYGLKTNTERKVCG